MNMSISGISKVAVFLLSLEPERAGVIMKKLSPEELTTVSFAMANLGTISSEEVEKILIEFVHTLHQSVQVIGTHRTTEDFLRQVLDEQSLNPVLEKLRNANISTTWELIANLDDSVIAQFIKNEYPQTAALILTKIPSYKASKILKILSREYVSEVMIRMIHMDIIKPDILNNIEKVLEAELLDRSSVLYAQDNNKVIAEIFNNFNRDDEQYFMNLLKERDLNAAQKISKLMLTIDDLIFIHPEHIQAILKLVDNNILIAALSSVSESIKDLFLSNMSQRVARIIKDELSEGAKYSPKDSFEAQVKVLKVVKKLLADNVITIDKNLDNR